MVRFVSPPYHANLFMATAAVRTVDQVVKIGKGKKTNELEQFRNLSSASPTVDLDYATLEIKVQIQGPSVSL